jgi:DeoR/GlpR family transcriptional regulator of sugar metabolism
MLNALRHERILDRLTAVGEVTVAQLAAELDCAPETVRHDLAALEAMARLRRVHGGAVQMPEPHLPPVRHRIARDRLAKDAVANAAIPLVPAGAQIFVGPGSTTLVLAVRLAELPSRCCFVTNMLDIAQLLSQSGRHDVRLLGGEMNGETRCTTGGDMLVDLKRWVFDLVIVGAAAIDARHGLMLPIASFGGMMETLRERSRERMVLADATKFTVPGRQVLWPWTAIDILVTDRRPSALFEQSVQLAGTRLVVARQA